MDLKKLYFEVKKHIDKVDFSKLWHGFQPLKFALYNETECFFDGNYVEKTEEFLANTAILYRGEWIAIWSVQEDMDLMVLASKIIHEMFHGFQRRSQERRFCDELDALYRYKYEEGNLNVKLMENQLLSSLVTQFDKEKFEEFLQIRKSRAGAYPYEYHYESCIEQIEGTANYVELSCLKQLSAELFEKKLAGMNEGIVNPDKLLPVRIICYDIGALLLFVMAENKITFEHDFSTVTFSESILKDVEERKFVPSVSIKERIERYYAKAEEVIKKAIEKNSIVNETQEELLGVNVYNAIYYKNHIISRYFVMYGSEEHQKIEYGDFVIETKECKKVAKIYRL